MRIKVGVVQESPVFFDTAQTLEKIEDIARNWAGRGCRLLLFPESFIPGYPRGFNFGTTVGNRTEEGRQLFLEFHKESISLKGEVVRQLAALSEDCGAYLVIGATEKDPASDSLFCSMLYFSPTQGLLGVHRKIKPTGSERVIWSEAAGDTLSTFDTRIGKLGGLICWENYMPLARMAMYRKGVEIYLAPTADARPQWIASMQHIALEGRCYVLGCNQFFTKSMYPERLQAAVISEQENLCLGGSVIVSPMGKILEGPLWDKSGVLVADLDLDEIRKSKLDFDVTGHYARNDIFGFEVTGQPEMQIEK